MPTVLQNPPESRSQIEDSRVLEMIDLHRYPLHRTDDPRLGAAVDRARDALARQGCAVIDRFIRPDMVADLTREIDALAPSAQFSTAPYTAYGTPSDRHFAPSHPRHRAHRTTSGNVTRDRIPGHTRIQQLHRSAPFKRFLAACLEVAVVHEFADPFRGLTINVMPDGATLGWHFDANEFVVSLMTRRAVAGGRFEYCPGIRAPGNENYPAVRAVLDGERRAVRSLDLRVGDLQLFKGRFALHRVSPVRGTRHTVLLGYASEPGLTGNVESTLGVYGRTAAAHCDAGTRHYGDGLAG